MKKIKGFLNALEHKIIGYRKSGRLQQEVVTNIFHGIESGCYGYLSYQDLDEEELIEYILNDVNGHLQIISVSLKVITYKSFEDGNQYELIEEEIED